MADESGVNPPQEQDRQPGREGEMHPEPVTMRADYVGTGKLRDRKVLLTGGDSGIGRAIARLFAREGADIGFVYLEEDEDAAETRRMVEEEGPKCLVLRGDVADEAFCQECVRKTVDAFGRIDCLINNAGVQFPVDSLEEIETANFERTMKVNFFSHFYMTKAALPHMGEGSTVLHDTSVNAYKGNKRLIDYSASKGAIVSFARSLAQTLAPRKIRVNAVAPGPIWTPLIPSTFPADNVAHFGEQVLMDRPGQPFEVATCFLFLASEDSSYLTGQVLHPNGGTIVNG